MLGLALAPVLTALALAGLACIVARHLYWWATGNQPTVPPIDAVALRVRRVS